jgi:ribosomal protein L19
MFTVRKTSEGVGVEHGVPDQTLLLLMGSKLIRRAMFVALACITSVQLQGKKARLKEAEKFGDLVPAQKQLPCLC